VLTAATIVVLLLGASIGILITVAKTDQPSVPGAGSVDVGFAHDMSAHHYQAVSMASWTRDHSADLSIKTIAMDIENTQTGQIGRMTGWLELWGQPELSDSPTRMAWMTGEGHRGGHSPGGPAATTMPGMATQEELTKLRSLSGAQLDVYFLQLMVRHHQGGLEMARYANEHAAQDSVRTLAGHMVAGQQAEVSTMTNMLAERGARPLPPP